MINMETIIKNTLCGDIKGLVFEGYNEYRGIKYATAERWKYPTQVTKWDGVYDATEWGACCYQHRAFEDDATVNAFYHNEFRRGLEFTYSEDCLFLNIWTPSEGENHPVAIYIHGGTFTGGSGNESHIKGQEFAKKGIVYATINYRLGPYGFCSHPDLTDENGVCGNFGLFDQQMALKWIKENIKAFGGDPDNITIMGQSAGCMSVDIQLTSDLNKDYFKGAYMMSAATMIRTVNKPMHAKDTKPYWEKVIKEARVNNMEELRKVDPKTLYYSWLNVYNSYNKLTRMKYTFPVFDPYILREDRLSVKNIPDIAYLIGMCSLDMLPPVLRFTDKLWAKTAGKQNKNKCYTYMFDHDLPGDSKRNWHCADMPYAFGNLKTNWRPFTEVDYKIEKEMFESVCAFIKTHNPNNEFVPEWGSDYKKTMTFDNNTTYRNYKLVKLLLHAGRQGPNR